MPRTFQTTHVYSSLILLFNGYKVTYPGVKRPEREVNHPPSSSVAVENEWRCSLFPIYSLVAWTKKVFLILVPRLDMRGAWCFLELALLPHRTCCTRPWCRWWLNYVQSFIKYVPCLLYRLLYRLTNAQHTHTHTHIYIYIYSFISIQPLGRFSRNQNPVRRPVWLWHTASWASS